MFCPQKTGINCGENNARRKLSKQLVARACGREKKQDYKWKEEAKQAESKNGKREVVREEEKTVIKRWCVDPFFCDVFEEFSPMDGSGKFLGESCCEVCGDSCGLSVLVLAVSSSGPEVTDVLVSPSSTGVRGEAFLFGF